MQKLSAWITYQFQGREFKTPALHIEAYSVLTAPGVARERFRAEYLPGAEIVSISVQGSISALQTAK